MNKINGYTEEEAKRLVEYVATGRKKGKTLTALFAEYGVRYGRAKGSVRNYYYALMKNEKADERIVKLLDGTELSVGKIRAFTEEEADEALRSILTEKAKGVSVRRAIFNLSGGDDKLMLRLQNKYRNTLKKNPEKIRALRVEICGEDVEEETPTSRKRAAFKDALREETRAGLQRKLEREINALYDRLTQGLKAENQRLRGENETLRAELEALKACLN